MFKLILVIYYILVVIIPVITIANYNIIIVT